MELSIELSTTSGMDSREIARITGKHHKHVCRDIIAMFEQMEGGRPNLDHPPEEAAKVQLPAGLIPFAHTYVHEQTRLRHRCFVLPKRECLILATSYDVVLRAKVIDRWAELEGQVSKPKDLSRIEILEMALEAERKVVALEAVVEAQAPAVRAQERLAKSEGLIGIREAAKRVGWPPKAFVALMVAGKHLFYEGGKLQARADHLAAGRFQMVTGVKEIAEGRDHEYGQVKFTTAGLTYFAAKMPDYIAPPKKPRKSRAKKKDAA